MCVACSIVAATATGGLPEAGLGQCTVVPVRPIEVPLDAASATPTWSARVYPPQEVSGWVLALDRLLSDAQLYAEVGQAGRQEALQFVGQGDGERASWLGWLATLRMRGGAGEGCRA